MDDTLTFEQQQEIDRLSNLANTPSSNSNKYRHQLYAYIDSVIAAHTQRARIDQIKRDYESLSMPYDFTQQSDRNIWRIDREQELPPTHPDKGGSDE